MKLLFVCGSRGEWGYIRPIIRLCITERIDYTICATNMLLLPKYGKLLDEIVRDGFNVRDQIYMSLEGDSHITMAKSLGIFLTSFVDVLARQVPTWVIVAGDRGEQFMASVAASYARIPLAHIQAGERSGNVDGMARHAIGKLANLHFAANEDAAARLSALGEEPGRIHNVGAPQIDEMVNSSLPSEEEISARLNLDVSVPYILLVIHPVTEEYSRLEIQLDALLDALEIINIRKVWILPNNDAGSEQVRDRILSRRDLRDQLYRNMSRCDYLAILKGAKAIVGNSSSGLLEAPTYGVPAVNIGRRQVDRVQGRNVINCEFVRDECVKAISRAISIEFRSSLKGCTNPYGDGRSAERIIQVLKSTSPTDDILIKRIPF